MNADDLINWSNLSKLLTNNRTAIRRGSVPKKYGSQISTVRRQLEIALFDISKISAVKTAIDYELGGVAFDNIEKSVYDKSEIIFDSETRRPLAIVDELPPNIKDKVTTASEIDKWIRIDNVQKYKSEGYETKYVQGEWYAKKK